MTEGDVVSGTELADLGTTLARRLRDRPSTRLLAQRRAVVVLDGGRGARWTVRLSDGRTSFGSGAAEHPDLTIHGDARLLVDIVAGRRSGVKAFLDSQVTVRGDLSLSLALDGVFAAEDRPVQWPHADLVDVPVGRRTVATAHLDAGPRDAPPVVLLHGLGATNASMLPVLWDLARDHRVLAPDLPGFGASDKPPASYTASFFSRWLASYLDTVGAPRAALVGNSMGGRVAIELGLREPHRVPAMVLLCPSPAFRRLRQWVPVVRLLRPEMARLPIPGPTHRMVVEAVRSMFSRPDRLAPSWYDAAADEFRRVFAEPGGRTAFFACARQIYLEEAVGERGFWDRLPSLTPRALFVWGDRDRLVPASFSRHVVAALPQAASIVLEDSGHVPQFEHPTETAGMIRGFLGEE